MLPNTHRNSYKAENGLLIHVCVICQPPLLLIMEKIKPSVTIIITTLAYFMARLFVVEFEHNPAGICTPHCGFRGMHNQRLFIIN